MPSAAQAKATWTKVAFGDVVRLVKDRSRDPLAEGIERYVGLEHLEPGQLRIRDWGLVADGTTFTSRFRPGQVLFGKRRAYQRKVAVADFDGVCSGDIYVLEPSDDRLLPDLLPYICQTDAFFENAVGTSDGSLSPRTNWKSLASFEFALPPVEEQAELVLALTAIERADEILTRSYARVRTLEVSALDFEFRSLKGLDRPLPDVAKVLSGGTPSKADQSLWGGAKPWASAKDLKVRELKDTELSLTEEGWQMARVAPKGATLVVVRGMILAHTFPVAKCVREVAFNQDLRAFIAGDGVLPEYLTLWFEWSKARFLTQVSESSHGTKRLEACVFEDAVIPLPRVECQEAILSRQGALIRASDELAMRRQSIQRLKRTALHRFL